MKILQINASAQSTSDHSSRLAKSITERIKAKYPDVSIALRDLANEQHPVLDEAAKETRTHDQSARSALDDSLIAQVQSADFIVIGVPMYNFGVPVQLKTWVDAISRVGVTFQYGANGLEGLIRDKRVFVALARGGLYRDTPADTQIPYIQNALGFLGMTDIEFVYAEGLAMGEESAKRALKEAREQIEALMF